MYTKLIEDSKIFILRFKSGKFDTLGIAQGTVDKKLGKISILRLTVRSESENWAILSEVIFIVNGDTILLYIRINFIIYASFLLSNRFI